LERLFRELPMQLAGSIDLPSTSPEAS
jgi:hypothetical protein